MRVRPKPAARLAAVSTAMSEAERATRTGGAASRASPASTAFAASTAGGSVAVTGGSAPAPAECVEFTQHRRAGDDLGEADPFAGGGERHDAGEQRGPPDRPGARRHRGAQQRPERV